MKVENTQELSVFALVQVFPPEGKSDDDAEQEYLINLVHGPTRFWIARIMSWAVKTNREMVVTAATKDDVFNRPLYLPADTRLTIEGKAKQET